MGQARRLRGFGAVLIFVFYLVAAPSGGHSVPCRRIQGKSRSGDVIRALLLPERGRVTSLGLFFPWCRFCGHGAHTTHTYIGLLLTRSVAVGIYIVPGRRTVVLPRQVEYLTSRITPRGQMLASNGGPNNSSVSPSWASRRWSTPGRHRRLHVHIFSVETCLSDGSPQAQGQRNMRYCSVGGSVRGSAGGVVRGSAGR